MKWKYLFASMLASGVISFAATRAMHGASEDLWGVLAVLALPGTIPAAMLALFAGVGNVHDPNIAVIDGSDFLFYSVLLYWLLKRWRVKRG